jgi:Protein of unknown function DUF262
MNDADEIMSPTKIAILAADRDAREVTREGSEGEDDLNAIPPSQLRDTILAATDWTTETIIRQLDRKNININPSFQRRDAWTVERKSTFIESLLMGLPIPQLVLAENKTKKGAYIVLDGKQRLLALRQFAAKDGDGYDALKLKGLVQRPELNGQTLLSMLADPAFSSDVSAFENETIRTVVVKNWPDENALYLIFLRLNTGSVALSPQELRQALHPGPFVTFVDTESATLSGLRVILNSPKPDFRMRDAELLVRHYAFQNFFTDYKGNMKLFLDDTCEWLNERWDQEEQKLRDELIRLDNAFSTTIEIFETNAFCKWDGVAYERRPNRAVVDIMTYYFSIPAIADAAIQNGPAVKQQFETLCSNSEFRRSLETTTKSLDATAQRFSAWGSALHDLLKLPLVIPVLSNKTITLQQL